MLEFFIAPLSFSFFQTALVSGVAISVICALVGTHLTFKGFSMIGDGLSHVGFGALACAAALGLAPLAVAIPAAVLCAFLLLRLAGRGGARADASIAMLSVASLAVGSVAVSFAGTNFDLNAYLFGSVLAVSGKQAPLLLLLCLAVLAVYLVCYPTFFALTFDEDFLHAKGAKTALFRSLLSALCAVIVVVGMQSVGALLISALLVFAPSAAACVCRSFRTTVLLSAVFAAVGFTTGLFLSYHLSLPAGAAVVLTHAALYLVCRCIGAVQKKK